MLAIDFSASNKDFCSSARTAVVVLTLSYLAKAMVSSFKIPFLLDLYVLKYGVLRELAVSFKLSTSPYEDFLFLESKVKLFIVSPVILLTFLYR